MSDEGKSWRPSLPDVVWAGDRYMNGDNWPDQITVRAWESTEDGERRISASRTYVPTDEDLV